MLARVPRRIARWVLLLLLLVPAAAAQESFEEYTVNPFDLIEITVYQENDLNKVVQVSRDGHISFPLIGKVKVAGLDLMTIEHRIETLLAKDYLVNPNVTVTVKEYNAAKVFVLGEVRNPGTYAITQDKGLTVLESIALAGGFNPTAAANSTKVIRVENGVKNCLEVKIGDLTKTGDKSKDISLQPNDIVLVPERMF